MSTTSTANARAAFTRKTARHITAIRSRASVTADTTRTSARTALAQSAMRTSSVASTNRTLTSASQSERSVFSRERPAPMRRMLRVRQRRRSTSRRGKRWVPVSTTVFRAVRGTIWRAARSDLGRRARADRVRRSEPVRPRAGAFRRSVQTLLFGSYIWSARGYVRLGRPPHRSCQTHPKKKPALISKTGWRPFL